MLVNADNVLRPSMVQHSIAPANRVTTTPTIMSPFIGLAKADLVRSYNTMGMSGMGLIGEGRVRPIIAGLAGMGSGAGAVVKGMGDLDLQTVALAGLTAFVGLLAWSHFSHGKRHGY